MEAISKLAMYILAIVIFIILFSFFFGPGSGFDAVRKAFSGVKESVNISIGASQVKGEKPALPAAQKEAISLLKRTMEKMKGKEQCFQNYKITGGGSDDGRNGLPLLGEEGTSIILEKEGDDMRMIILGGISGKQEISREIITAVNPCVVSGKNVHGESIPRDFQSHFTENRGSQDTSYYNAVEKILITSDGSENKISYNDGTLLDFEDGGLIYTSDGRHICFFPTEDFGTSSEGIDDDLLGDADPDVEYSFTALISAGKFGMEWCQ